MAMVEPDRRPTAQEIEELIDLVRRDPASPAFIDLGEAYLALGRPRDALQVGNVRRGAGQPRGPHHAGARPRGDAPVEGGAGRALARGQGRPLEPPGVRAARRGAAAPPGLRARGAGAAARADPRSDEPADPRDAQAGARRAAARPAAADAFAGAAARRDRQ